MRERPKEFRLLAAILIIVAASFPLQVMATYGYTLAEFEAALAGLGPLNWLVIGASLIHAFLIYEASAYVLASTPIYLALVIWNNWVVARTGLNASVGVVGFATVAAILIHVPIFRRDLRKIFFNPGLRWWRTSPRRRASVRAIIRPVLGGEMQSQTFDLSASGAFITTQEASWLSRKDVNVRLMHRTNLKVGARCSVRLMIDHMRVVQCGAEIVRHSEAQGSRPAGFAVRFVCLDEQQKKILKEFIQATVHPGLIPVKTG